MTTHARGRTVAIRAIVTGIILALVLGSVVAHAWRAGPFWARWITSVALGALELVPAAAFLLAIVLVRRFRSTPRRGDRCRAVASHHRAP